MYIVHLIYEVPLEKVNEQLTAHGAFLDEQYALGNFLASGPQVPRTGGVILSSVSDKNELIAILEKDPFIQHKVARYELIEFLPTKTCPELEFLKEKGK